MRFVTDLSKGILGALDSSELWTEITSHIPDEVLLKPNVKILNVACGHGTEADIIAGRMIALGKSKEEVRNSIYVLDKYHVFTNQLMRKGYKHVINADFLTWKTNMEFDVVVGNPPYQASNGSKRKKLWVEFAKKAFDLAPIVAMVTPNAWKKETIYFKEIATKIKKKAAYHNPDVSEYFPQVGEDIGAWVIDDAVRVPIHIEEDIATTIFKKMKRKGGKWHYRDIAGGEQGFIDRGMLSETKTAEFDYPLYWTAAQEYKWTKPEFVRQGWKVIVNNSGGYHDFSDPDRYSVLNNDVAVGLGAWGIAVETEEQGKNVLSWVRSKLYTVIVMKSKSGGFNNVFVEMEHLGVDHAWTDEELYAHFNLTPEEIEYIEKNA